MDEILGLLGMAIFIPSVVAVAAFVTWMVVRISPAPNPDKDTKASA